VGPAKKVATPYDPEPRLMGSAVQSEAAHSALFHPSPYESHIVRVHMLGGTA
jgi:hypothetical protein